MELYEEIPKRLDLKKLKYERLSLFKLFELSFTIRRDVYEFVEEELGVGFFGISNGIE